MTEDLESLRIAAANDYVRFKAAQTMGDESLAKRFFYLFMTKYSRLLGYDPDQPRVPAGSSDGGQWTSGSYTSGYGGKYARVGQVDESQIDDWTMSVAPDLPETDPRKTAVAVAQSAADWETGAKGVYDKNGKMQAVYHGEVIDQDQASAYMGMDIEATRPYVLGELAVNPENLEPGGERGWGVKALYEAANDAVNAKANGFYLHSASSQSNRFYEKCGMTKLDTNSYGWDGADLRYFVRSWERYGQAEE